MPVRVLLLLFLSLPGFLMSQDHEVVSIHMLDSERHADLAGWDLERIDSMNQFARVTAAPPNGYSLTRRVFGYHPYWGGSNYLNYRWDLLSDLCHFSYEVDPASGLPLTLHDWSTSPAIDSAFAHGVKVHLCVTLFSGHSVFFSNPTARQNLIDQVIDLVASRGAHGVNMDIEALPLSQKEAFHDFMADLCPQVKEALPDAEISIAAPAVNWSEKFDIPLLDSLIDFFMVMGYDYYWGGSAFAGPVSPLYPMTGSYDYSFSRTISYYQSQGVSSDRIIMGVPYYAYQWKTESQYAPSATIGSGAAYTYRYVMDNPNGNYSPENKHMEPNSFAPYFSFEAAGWNQCFLDDAYSLGEKYDIVNRRNLAGIGIWALGYDNGHTELWDLISSRFTTEAAAVNADTIFDTGGPAFDYYDNEDYSYTITTSPGTTVYLSFSYLDTESGYDTLWVFEGPDTTASPLGVYSGDEVPALIHSATHELTLLFKSDGATRDAGWRAVFDTIPVSGIRKIAQMPLLSISPNPSGDHCTVTIPGPPLPHPCRFSLYDLAGNPALKGRIPQGKTEFVFDTSILPTGLYSLVVGCGESSWSGKVIIWH